MGRKKERERESERVRVSEREREIYGERERYGERQIERDNEREINIKLGREMKNSCIQLGTLDV